MFRNVYPLSFFTSNYFFKIPFYVSTMHNFIKTFATILHSKQYREQCSPLPPASIVLYRRTGHPDETIQQTNRKWFTKMNVLFQFKLTELDKAMKNI
jgi:hypothetical protein